MAMEPINVFSRIADPALVARRLRELAPATKFDGPDDAWRKAVVPFGKWPRKKTLTINHDPNYYAEPGWSVQMEGMRGYFSRFPDSDNKAKVMALTTTFRFALATEFEPEFNPKDDPRLDLLFALTETLDGVLFSPSTMRDHHGRILIHALGAEHEDPKAVWPKVLGEVQLTDPAGAAMHEASRPKQDVDEIEGEPPSPERVARRALALMAVTGRAVVEQDARKGVAGTENFLADLHRWIETIDLRDEFEPDEWKALQTPLRKLDRRSQINFTWRMEALAVLAWALKRFDIPPHDESVTTGPLCKGLGGINVERSRALLANPDLRSRGEINTLRNRLFAIHWRTRNFGLRPEVMDFAEFAKTCWFGPLDIEGLPLIKGDMAIGGKRIDRALASRLDICNSIAVERHMAANWLLEGPELFSEASQAT